MKSQKLLDFGIWDLQKAFGSLGPRRRIKPLTLSRTLAPIFANRISFSPESLGESNKIIKFLKIS